MIEYFKDVMAVKRCKKKKEFRRIFWVKNISILTKKLIYLKYSFKFQTQVEFLWKLRCNIYCLYIMGKILTWNLLKSWKLFSNIDSAFVMNINLGCSSFTFLQKLLIAGFSLIKILHVKTMSPAIHFLLNSNLDTKRFMTFLLLLY